MRSRCPWLRNDFIVSAAAVLVLFAAARPAAAGSPLRGGGELLLLFADGFESGDTSLWPLELLLWLPFGASDLTLTVQFAPVDPGADLTLSLDQTGSMGGEIANLQATFSTLVTSARALVPDTAFAAASWQDFPVSPFGDPPGTPGNPAGDLPWRLRQAVTTNTSLVLTALFALAPLGGNDTPESGYEALYQVGAGTGVSWPGGSVPPYTGPGLGGSDSAPARCPWSST